MVGLVGCVATLLFQGICYFLGSFECDNDKLGRAGIYGARRLIIERRKLG